MGGDARPRELYDLASDLGEQQNRIEEPALQPLVTYLTAQMKSIHARGAIRSAAAVPTKH